MKKGISRIVICICTFDLGGAERQAILLAKGLKSRGYNVEILGLGPLTGNALPFLSQSGVKFRSLNIPFSDRDSYQKNVSDIEKYLAEMQIDSLLPFTYWPNLYCCSSFKQVGINKCYWNQRDIGTGIRFSEMEQYALNCASGIIANSQEGIEFLDANFNIKGKYTTVIHNGVYFQPTSLSKPILRKTLGIPDKDFIAVMVANLNDRKDHVTLLKAWAKFLKKSKKNSQLLLLGKKDETYPLIEQIIDELNITSSVKILDFVEDVSKYIVASDLGILSTYTEGLPNSILEYMAAGLPVIATDIGGDREALGREYPLLFPLGDDERLSELILSMQTSWIKRRYYGYKNKKRLEKNFSIEVMVDKYINLLETND